MQDGIDNCKKGMNKNMSNANSFCLEVRHLTTEILSMMQKQQQERKAEQTACITALSSLHQQALQKPVQNSHDTITIQSKPSTEGFMLPRLRF